MAVSTGGRPFRGSTLGYDVLGGATYVNIAKLTQISGIGVTRPGIDVTNNDSANNTGEFIPSHSMPKAFTVSGNFISDNATQKALALTAFTEDWDVAGAYTWKLSLAAGYTTEPTITFKAFMSDFEFSGSQGGHMTFSMQIQVSEVLTWVNGTP